MPFALTLIGVLLVVVGFQDTYKAFGSQLQKDVTGEGNFVYWIISLGIIGALGYVKELQTFSRLTMGLIILVMVLANKGLFAQFNSAIKSGTTSPVNPVGTPLQGSPSSGDSGQSSGGSGSITGLAQSAGSLASLAEFF